MLPSTRREARERALALLYEAESKRMEPAVVLADLPVPPDPFVADLVGGVHKEQARIDDLIASHGADYPMPNLLNHLAAPGCSRLGSTWDRCGVHYVEPIEGG